MTSSGSALPARLSLLVVDDHPLIRRGIRGLVSTAVPELEFLEAGGAQEALAVLASRVPDVVIVDMALPDRGGLDLIREVRAGGLKVPIIALSIYAEDLYAERALRAGASGYVMKEEAGAVLLEALERVVAGEVHLSPEVARRIAGRLVAPQSPSGSIPDLLTDRELEVWCQLGSGFSTRRIASALGISPKTVETHCYNIRQKTGIGNMTELVHAATRWLHVEGGAGP